MNQFIKKVSLFVVSTIVLLYLVQYIIDTGLHKANVNVYHDWNIVFNGEASSDIIILGNSRAKVHFDSKIIEDKTQLSCYNLGLDGAGLLMQQTKLNSYLLYNKKPKIIIQNIDILSFNPNNEIAFKETFLPYIDKSEIYNPLSKIDSNLWKDKYLPLYKYHSYPSYFLLGFASFFNLAPPLYSKYRGYEAREIDWIGSNLKANENIIKDEQYNYDFSILKKIEKFCDKNGILLILVITPQYSSSIYNIKQEIFLQKILDFKKVYPNIVLLDFINSIDIPRKYFYKTIWFLKAKTIVLHL